MALPRLMKVKEFYVFLPLQILFSFQEITFYSFKTLSFKILNSVTQQIEFLILSLEWPYDILQKKT